ncbi:MAG: hypothetical protein HOI35_10155 [Woeseia sp.]|jgi:hypothetical protein|nr:hypothetical protein [Woeseia sp.]MBT6210370.1 hypothetical protein [Woeseia sp.]
MVGLLAVVLASLICVACDGLSGTVNSSDGDPPIADNDQVQNRGVNKDNWWDSLPRSEWGAFDKVAISDDWFEVYRIDDEI